MKRNIILSAITGAALLLLTASCSNTDENNEQKEPTQTVQFSFTNEDFGEDETPTRAAVAAKPQIVDLGDCEAEITVENEPAAKKTRGAQTPANGHYTIRAYQGGVLKGEMSGTFNGGTFTPDVANKGSIKLAHGTYDFVAFNDDVIPSGNDLTVARDKAATAMMGTTTEIIGQAINQEVSFVMKHVGSRLKVRFESTKHFAEGSGGNIAVTLEGLTANAIPVSLAYNPATKSYTTTNGTMAPEAFNLYPYGSGMPYVNSFYGRYYYYYAQVFNHYHYFLPTTEASNLKISFSGSTLFWKPLSGNQKLNTTLSMESGKSYIISIKFRPSYTYLMSNGDTGTFRETTAGGGSKIPIAVVVDKDNHMAVALNDAGNMAWCRTNNYLYGITNTNNVSNLDNALTGSATKGIDETWEASYSNSNVTGEKVKGKNPNFLVFKAAAEYNPGVAYTGTTPLKWYLPSCSDWEKVAKVLGFAEEKHVNITTYPMPQWYGYLASEAFTRVGGTGFFKWYWTSTEHGTHNAGTIFPQLSSTIWQSREKQLEHSVRPFVKY